MPTGKKFGGRQKGTPNKKTKDIREKIKSLIDSNIDRAQADLELLEPKDRLAFIEKLFKYAVPTLQSVQQDVSISGQLNALNPDQINDLYQKIITQSAQANQPTQNE